MHPEQPSANPYAGAPLPQKPRTYYWLGFGAAVVVLLCLCSAGAIAVASWRESRVNANQHQQSDFLPAGDSLSPVGIVVPTALGGRRIYGLPRFAELEGQVTAAISEVAELNMQVSGSYNVPANDSSLASQRLVIITAGLLQPGWKGKVTPQNVFAGIRARTPANPANIVDISPGSLGGQAQCGSAKIDGYETAVCAWTDRFTVGFVVSFGSTLDEAKAEFVTIRELIEQRR